MYLAQLWLHTGLDIPRPDLTLKQQMMPLALSVFGHMLLVGTIHFEDRFSTSRKGGTGVENAPSLCTDSISGILGSF